MDAINVRFEKEKYFVIVSFLVTIINNFIKQ